MKPDPILDARKHILEWIAIDCDSGTDRATYGDSIWLTSGAGFAT
jgi:hypothetical protein